MCWAPAPAWLPFLRPLSADRHVHGHAPPGLLPEAPADEAGALGEGAAGRERAPWGLHGQQSGGTPRSKLRFPGLPHIPFFRRPAAAAAAPEAGAGAEAPAGAGAEAWDGSDSSRDAARDARLPEAQLNPPTTPAPAPSDGGGGSGGDGNNGGGSGGGSGGDGDGDGDGAHAAIDAAPATPSTQLHPPAASPAEPSRPPTNPPSPPYPHPHEPTGKNNSDDSNDDEGEGPLVAVRPATQGNGGVAAGANKGARIVFGPRALWRLFRGTRDGKGDGRGSGGSGDMGKQGPPAGVDASAANDHKPPSASAPPTASPAAPQVGSEVPRGALEAWLRGAGVSTPSPPRGDGQNTTQGFHWFRSLVPPRAGGGTETAPRQGQGRGPGAAAGRWQSAVRRWAEGAWGRPVIDYGALRTFAAQPFRRTAAGAGDLGDVGVGANEGRGNRFRPTAAVGTVGDVWEGEDEDENEGGGEVVMGLGRRWPRAAAVTGCAAVAPAAPALPPVQVQVGADGLDVSALFSCPSLPSRPVDAATTTATATPPTGDAADADEDPAGGVVDEEDGEEEEAHPYPLSSPRRGTVFLCDVPVPLAMQAPAEAGVEAGVGTRAGTGTGVGTGARAGAGAGAGVRRPAVSRRVNPTSYPPLSPSSTPSLSL